ncbi:hypothetical protein RQP46_001588 [Phenoliferia psychrophenolica]
MSVASEPETAAIQENEAPPPPTSLLSVPPEILSKIAWDVAVNGGRKAGNLRLVCRHLGRVVAPVTWASIVLPADADSLDEIAAELVSNATQNTGFVTSVRYNRPDKQLRVVVSAVKALPSLRRLHLAGTDAIGGLFVPQHDLLKSWPLLDALQLDHVDLQSKGHIQSWAPNLSSLGLVGCSYATDPFAEGTALRYNTIKNIQFLSPRSDIGYQNTVDRVVMVLWACASARSLSVVLEPDVTTSWAEKILMDVDTNTSNYTQLVRFLELASLPSLSTLHLRGCLEGTGISNLALVPIEDLAAKAPLVFVLLGVLRQMPIVELRLESATGSADGVVQCVFSRGKEDEWTSKVVRFW